MIIAILGAGGQIGKALRYEFESNGHYVFPYSRTLDNYSLFNMYKYDMVINCIGAGKPKDISSLGWELYKIDEQYDRMVIDYLHAQPDTIYAYISSGAVHGTDKIYYTMLKRTAECRHRNLPQFHIADIRVFSFVSEFMDLESKFFIGEVFRCIKTGETFNTASTDLVRDYVDAKDLYQLIIKLPKKNDYYEAFSEEPVGKWEVLDYYKNEYGLKVNIQEVPTSTNSTFVPLDFKAKEIGYSPKISSYESIINAGLKIL